MDRFFHIIDRARDQALELFGRELPREDQASAMVHLAESLMMFAEDRAGTEFAKAWTRKIAAHLDRDDMRAAQAVIGVQEPRLH